MRVFELSNPTAGKPVVYLDLDGVLADFFGEAARREGVDHWRRARKVKDRIDQVAQETGFFMDLPPLPHAEQLVSNVVKMAGQYSILSSPLMSNVEESTREKTQWLQHYLKNMQPQSVLFDHNKEKFARQADGVPNILIDDWDANIKLWEANGGIGILYTDDNWDRALKKLQQALHHGQSKKPAKSVAENQEQPDPLRLMTCRDVLKYIKSIHREYHLDGPVLRHKAWILHRVPIDQLWTPEYYDQDDPYRRVIDLDWDHIGQISRADLEQKPIVADHNGWILDGNHRVMRARMLGLDHILAITPYKK